MAQSYEIRIRRVLEYIFDHPDGDLSLDRLADIAAMSRFHWRRVFHAMTGETCADAVRRIRMQRAAGWLTETPWPNAEVAARVGYRSVQSFTRAFGEHFGVTPAQFRNRNQFDLMLSAPERAAGKEFRVSVENCPALCLMAIAHQGPYADIGRAFERLSASFQSTKPRAGMPGLVGLYYDDPAVVRPEELKSYACLEANSEAAILPGLEAMTLQGGCFATLKIRGPYGDASLAYDYLFRTWLAQSGKELRDGPIIERYLNLPAASAPADLQTEILVPLKG